VVDFSSLLLQAKRARCLSTSLLLIWLAVFLSACDAPPAFESVRFSGGTMGTTYNVTVVTPSGTTLPEGLGDSIQGWLDEVNQHMSTYIDDSELSRLNRAPVGEWLPVSPMMLRVLKQARAVSDITGGAFDITIGPLVDAWGFGPVDTHDQVPAEAALEALQQKVGYTRLRLRDSPPALWKEAELQLDLSAIAKGFGADYVAEQLAAAGLPNSLVEIGGDLRVQGHNAAGKPWRIGVEQPSFQREGVQQAVELDNGGVATSGDYRNFFRQNGQMYSHILDPRLGRPVERDLASVTVIADNAAMADALATGLTVMGREAALALAEQQNLPVFLIIKREVVRKGEGFDTAQSSAFASYLGDD